jgi:hypothetical protein
MSHLLFQTGVLNVEGKEGNEKAGVMRTVALVLALLATQPAAAKPTPAKFAHAPIACQLLAGSAPSMPHPAFGEPGIPTQPAGRSDKQ